MTSDNQFANVEAAKQNAAKQTPHKSFINSATEQIVTIKLHSTLVRGGIVFGIYNEIKTVT